MKARLSVYRTPTGRWTVRIYGRVNTVSIALRGNFEREREARAWAKTKLRGFPAFANGLAGES